MTTCVVLARIMPECMCSLCLQVNAFVVKKGTKGFKTSKIEGKIALRCVQNADITLTNCFVPDSARLPGVNNFQVRQACIDTYHLHIQ